MQPNSSSPAPNDPPPNFLEHLVGRPRLSKPGCHKRALSKGIPHPPSMHPLNPATPSKRTASLAILLVNDGLRFFFRPFLPLPSSLSHSAFPSFSHFLARRPSNLFKSPGAEKTTGRTHCVGRAGLQIIYLGLRALKIPWGALTLSTARASK